MNTTLHLLRNRCARGNHIHVKATRILQVDFVRHALMVDVPPWVSKQIPLYTLGNSTWKLPRKSHFAVGWIRIQNSSKHYCSDLLLLYRLTLLSGLVNSECLEIYEGNVANSCYHSYQPFDIETRRRRPCCFVLTLSPRSYAFLKQGNV